LTSGADHFRVARAVGRDVGEVVFRPFDGVMTLGLTAGVVTEGGLLVIESVIAGSHRRRMTAGATLSW
jgi:hypothetical protein